MCTFTLKNKETKKPLKTKVRGHLGGSVDWASAFSSDYDLRVVGSSSKLGSLLGREPASPLSLPASLPTCDLSLCHINK